MILVWFFILIHEEDERFATKLRHGKTKRWCLQQKGITKRVFVITLVLPPTVLFSNSTISSFINITVARHWEARKVSQTWYQTMPKCFESPGLDHWPVFMNNYPTRFLLFLMDWFSYQQKWFGFFNSVHQNYGYIGQVNRF